MKTKLISMLILCLLVGSVVGQDIDVYTDFDFVLQDKSGTSLRFEASKTFTHYRLSRAGTYKVLSTTGWQWKDKKGQFRIWDLVADKSYYIGENKPSPDLFFDITKTTKSQVEVWGAPNVNIGRSLKAGTTLSKARPSFFSPGKYYFYLNGVAIHDDLNQPLEFELGGRSPLLIDSLGKIFPIPFVDMRQVSRTKYKIGDKGPQGRIVFYDRSYLSDGWQYKEVWPETILNTVPNEQNRTDFVWSDVVGAIEAFNVDKPVKWQLTSQDELIQIADYLYLKGLYKLTDDFYFCYLEDGRSGVLGTMWPTRTRGAHDASGFGTFTLVHRF